MVDSVVVCLCICIGLTIGGSIKAVEKAGGGRREEVGGGGPLTVG